MNTWQAIALLLVLVLGINYATALIAPECPENTYGTSENKIKYFSSPFCTACWIQKPIIKQLANEGIATFEEYNADYCKQASQPHKITGVPSFIINDKVVYGVQTEKQLRELIK